MNPKARSAPFRLHGAEFDAWMEDYSVWIDEGVKLEKEVTDMRKRRFGELATLMARRRRLWEKQEASAKEDKR